jgi:hypothetical protein
VYVTVDTTLRRLPKLAPGAPSLLASAAVCPNGARAKTVLPTLDPSLSVSAWAESQFNFIADPVQARILNSHTHRLILCCTRQWGKSSLAALKAFHLAVAKPGALVLFASPSFHQSAELLRKFRHFAFTLTGSPGQSDGIHLGSLLLPNRSRIVALPQSPDTIRGFSAVDLVVIDEAAFVHDEMHHALSPMLATSDGQLWLLSSPSGPTGEFHKIWTANLPGWQRFSVNALECPRISPAFLQRERLAKGEAVFNREYMCQFIETAKPSINPADIDFAFRGQPISFNQENQ